MAVAGDKQIDVDRAGVNGPGDYVKEKYDAMIQGAGGRLWHGLVNMSGGAVFKGALIAAALFVAAWAIGAAAMGVGATGGLIVGGLTINTLEAGMAAGISKGLALLTVPWVGASVLSFGGAVGAMFEKAKQKAGSLNADEARTQAEEYEHARQIEQEKQIQPSQSRPYDEPPPPAQSSSPDPFDQPPQGGGQSQGMNATDNTAQKKSFCGCEKQRQAENMNNQQGQSYGR